MAYNGSMANRTSRSNASTSGTRARARRNVTLSNPKKRIKNLFALALLGLLTLVAMTLVAFLAIFWRFSAELPGIEAVTAEIKGPVPTTVFSEDGVLLAKLDVVNQQPVALDQVPKNLIDATVAVEDHRFWDHPGIDIQGIGRAIVANVRGSGLHQGASTLTQQFVRQPEVSRSLNPTGPSDNRFGLSGDKKYSRKIREALIALRIEQIYSKKEILQLYLNNVYYGSGAYGVQAASETYFGKSAEKLSLADAALLAGLPQRPSRFTPFDHLKAALKRRDEVLNAMQTYGYISAADCEEAKAETPKLAPQPDHKLQVFRAPYFTTYVLEQIRKKYGQDYLYSGLKIETTLNFKMQKMAEQALEQGIKNASNGANQGAVVSLDNKTGYIRALVGGRDYRASRFNAVTQGRRQPGSAFKAFVYSAAFDTDTFKLDDALSDTYFAYPGDPKHRGVDGETNRTLDFATAIAKSSNSVAVQVAYKVGIRTVIQYAHKMGITTRLDPYLPTAIGASAVRPLDICSAYSIFAMNGSRAHPMSVVRITDGNGNIVEENTPDIETEILKQSTVDQMNTAFEAVVQRGTGVAARGNEQNGIIENARGKTGTTNDSRDVWFVGYTPELTTAIWVANVKVVGTKTKRYVYREMPGAFGGSVCAPIWHDFMLKAVPEERKFKLLVNNDTSQPPVDPNQTTGAEKPKPHTTKKKPTDVKPTPTVTPPDGASAPDSGGDMSPEPTGSGESAPPTNQVDPLPSDGGTEPARGGTVDSGAPSAPAVRTTIPTPPQVRHTAPPTAPRTAAPPELVSVRVCVDSGQRAGKWCTETKTVRVTAPEAAKMHRCTLHKPPPGETE
ncbi:MAG: penicillin-binding protein family [Chthonomonadaceae bacterium]|nr:penicillin-binding protein family [Chthonomonadaceae bacterium]